MFGGNTINNQYYLFTILVIFASSLVVKLGLSISIGNNYGTHLIEFVGIENDYNNLTLAKERLKSSLENMLNHKITIDYMSENDAKWFSETLNSVNSTCPESEIKDMVSLIVDSDGKYTRNFKLSLTEEFRYPKSIFVKWFGACANVERKRTLSGNLLSAQDDNVDGIIDMELPSDLANNTPASSILSVPVTVSGSTIESKPPTTTTDPPSTTVTMMETTTVTPTPTQPPTTIAELEETVTTVSSTTASVDDLAFPMFPDVESSLNLTIATDTNATTTTSSSSEPIPGMVEIDKETISAETIKPLNFTELPSTIANLTTITETPTTTTPSRTTEFFESTPVFIQDSVNKTAVTTEATTTTTTVTSSDSSSQKKEGETSQEESQGYGKYIGLGAAFLVFAAYLICSRSYRSQTYELHND